MPKAESSYLNQEQSCFYLKESGKERKIIFRDYNEIYKTPGLYEQLFYDRLKCSSPVKESRCSSYVSRIKEYSGLM